MASEGKLRAKPLCIETWLAGTGGATRGEVAHNDGSNGVINADADADENFGIFLEDADSGTYVKVCTLGLCLAVAYDDAITAGDWLIANANGRLDGIGTLTGGSQYPVAQARSGSDAAGQLIPVFVNPHIATKSAS